MKGVVLLAVKSPAYGNWAYQFALGLRVHSPEIPIQLVCSEGAIKHLGSRMCSLFTDLTIIDESKFFLDEKFQPGYVKLHLNKYLKYSRSLYFDVDGLPVGPIDHLFELMGDRFFAVQKGTGNMGWASHEDISQEFDFDKGLIKGINSSFMFFKKGAKLNSLFSACRKAMEQGTNLKQKWGGTQPDELYLCIGMCQKEVIEDCVLPIEVKPVYFRVKTEAGLNGNMAPDGLTQIQEHYPIIGLFGAKNLNHRCVYHYYDSLVKLYARQLGMPNIIYMSYQLMRQKHVLNV